MTNNGRAWGTTIYTTVDAARVEADVLNEQMKRQGEPRRFVAGAVYVMVKGQGRHIGWTCHLPEKEGTH